MRLVKSPPNPIKARAERRERLLAEKQSRYHWEAYVELSEPTLGWLFAFLGAGVCTFFSGIAMLSFLFDHRWGEGFAFAVVHVLSAALALLAYEKANPSEADVAYRAQLLQESSDAADR